MFDLHTKGIRRMNNFSLVFIILFMLCVLISWKRGLFRSILSTAGIIASIIIAVFVAPYVSGFLHENTDVDEKMAAVIEQKLGFDETKEAETRSAQVATVNALLLPERIKACIVDNNNSEIYSVLGVDGVYAYIAKAIAVLVLNAIVFLVLMLLSKFIFFVMSRRMVGLLKLPIIRSVDKVGGGCLGVVKGLIYTWLFFLILSIGSAWEWSANLIQQIDENPLLKLLYDNNLLLDVVGDLTKILFD